MWRFRCGISAPHYIPSTNIKKNIETKERTFIYHWFGNIDVSRAATVIMEKEKCLLPAMNSNSSDAGLLNPLHQTDRLLQLLTTNVKHWTVSHSAFTLALLSFIFTMSQTYFNISFLLCFISHTSLLMACFTIPSRSTDFIFQNFNNFFFLHLSHLNQKLHLL